MIDPKPTPRHRADRLEWEQIVRRKLGVCRCCGGFGAELHHLVARSLRGSDVAENIVSLCRTCHQDVEAWESDALSALRQNLRPDELRYILATKGADYLERRYPLPAEDVA